MKPFLMHFVGELLNEESPDLIFDESLSLNVPTHSMEKLHAFHSMLATQTVTKAKRETTDDD